MFSKRMIIISILSMLSLATIIDYSRVGGRSLTHGCLLAILGLLLVIYVEKTQKKTK
ncbi:hypothetical protein P4493_05065 [Bacillus thuringiensis]|jgi:hypothetical protein|uniref:Membrane protein n=1 Tax=Bacillus thuringiensis TaxID=1428 RepID=A0A0B5NBN2_BACTU|nr:MULTISPECIES: hypothetical protein [Bacillus]MEC2535604.1 hypothetical protein [Bacillus cereus]MED1153635.1 hypothetical protein [Bacillus paranthracis]AJG73810.1 putative membrane protein [Bacillus thuringiensis]AJH02803.1 putative membrane protein [Bacillus thuringiensis HD1002]EEM74185.1 hypothetical protein bthur0010_58450 [Bacillus thuringiensis serovar pondicheriensis BGSC 4BA1]